MARYKVTIAYDGTPFKGFQRQAQDLTVQGAIEAALKKIGWQGSSILAAGRTDTGVHAIGQVIAFDLAWRHSEADLLNALNANLPLEIAARSVAQVGPAFHPRYDATSRCYHYRITSDQNRNPLVERFAWRVYPLPDVQKMQQAAGLLVGKHDFGAFGSPPLENGNSIRTVLRAEWFSFLGENDQPGLRFEIEADAFLYRMVRRCVSSLVEIGLGKTSLEALAEHLEKGAAAPVQGIAPPNGLVLWAVRYPADVL